MSQQVQWIFELHVWGFEKDKEMVDDCPPECYEQQ